MDGIIVSVSAQTNRLKSANCRVNHAKSAGRDASGDKRLGAPIKYYREEYAKVCLNCKKEKCNGGAACFRRERDKNAED